LDSTDIGYPGGFGDFAVTLTQPGAWARAPDALQDGLSLAGYLVESERRGFQATPRQFPRLAPPEDRLVYTVPEAAALLGISRAFAYEAVKRGDIPSMRIGRRILVPKAALERFLAESGNQPGSPGSAA
jgi:excisionase family DNA binding protein